jgi:trehalose/maltose hydrolase-like predicted phosphorylase
VRDLEQSYDFSTGELSRKLVFAASGNAVHCEVLTFASREDPTLVCQELSLTAERACDLKLRAMIDAAGISGRARRQTRSTPGESKPSCDGSVLWESSGGIGLVGLAYVSQILGRLA